MATLDNFITEFQIFYEKIYAIYNLPDSATDRWKNIAEHMHENSNVVKDVFSGAKKNDAINEIVLDYTSDITKINERISSEAESIVKTSLIISALHYIVYDLLSTSGNYSFILDGQQEMAVLKKDVKYYVSVSEKPEKNVYFHAFILTYALESLFNRNFYIGIDYEYTARKIQLAQLNFEHHEDLRSIIMVVSPNDLKEIMMEHFVKLIICNRFIKKILHGSDSLDIPYMYEHMLANDPDKIIKFTKTLIDTRFLCEYYKLNKPNALDGRCSIYDSDNNSSAVFYFGVIDEQQQQNLAKLLMEDLPAPNDIVWRISKLNTSQLRYAVYDVLYLKWFYYRIIHLATEEVADDLAKKSVIELYKKVLNELTSFSYLEKKNITYMLEKCKTEVDPVNNFMVRKPTKILKLIDIYNDVSKNITTAVPRTDIDKIIKVNYYKGPVTTILKRMTYAIISRKCRVFKDKTTTWNDKMDNQFIFEFLKMMEFYHLEKMLREIETILEARVVAICSK